MKEGAAVLWSANTAIKHRVRGAALWRAASQSLDVFTERSWGWERQYSFLLLPPPPLLSQRLMEPSDVAWTGSQWIYTNMRLGFELSHQCTERLRTGCCSCSACHHFPLHLLTLSCNLVCFSTYLGQRKSKAATTTLGSIDHAIYYSIFLSNLGTTG